MGDLDLRQYIREAGGSPPCSFCGSRKAPTAPLDDLGEFISDRLLQFYGKAVDNLPYESAEGGYQGWNVDTQDLLFDVVGLELPRDRDGRLAQALVDQIGDDAWCEFDWLDLEYDDGLRSDWDRFCETVKYKRRFFFHNLGSSTPPAHGERSFQEFFSEICNLANALGLVEIEAAGFTVFRARDRKYGQKHATSSALGPPPQDKATQSNRMNPPGIPMFYGAESKRLACTEVKSHYVSVGRFRTTRKVSLLSLHKLPPVPGFFSSASRKERLGLAFLHSFAKQIAIPVERDERVHVTYLPTQVFTEFVRDFSFDGVHVDGVSFSSSTGVNGANVTLFATQEDIVGTAVAGAADHAPWLELVDVSHENVDARARRSVRRRSKRRPQSRRRAAPRQ